MKMNRKLVLLLIPLLLLPMAGFGFAHWTDTIRKNYYMRAGTVKTEIVFWHILETNTYDADCDDEIYGDEIRIEPIWEWDDELLEYEIKKLDIIVDPIYPSWFLSFEMIIHNKGRLVIKPDLPTFEWTGPQENMMDNLPTPEDYIDPETGIPKFFQYYWAYYIWDDTLGNWIEAEPTTSIIKPSHYMRVVQYIHFIGQDYPEIQCHWLDLHVGIPFFQYIGTPWGSEPFGAAGEPPYELPIPRPEPEV